MGSYVPNTREEQQALLHEAGYASIEEMLKIIPEKLQYNGLLNLPSGLSELEVTRKMKEMSDKNVIYKSIFRGAGSYRHYIPSIVKSVVSKEEFVTSYTPYQAEISQGILQAIFEFQTMICELTGMDASNASHYDGATAAAEAIMMCKDKKHKNAYVSEAINPLAMNVIETYCFANETNIIKVPAPSGVTDVKALEALLSKDSEAACLYIQSPNFYGCFEEAETLGNLIHEANGKFIMGVNPISLGISKSPAEYAADIAVGDGQPLGLSIGFGGPYVGFMATTSKMLRKLPGRIVGETTDDNGNRAFVLTLQAREQHIRREKASSNICSNQDLCALTASVYMAAMGSQGLTEVARQSMAKAHYLREQLAKISFVPVYDCPFFNEFVTSAPGDVSLLMKKLSEKGILGGLPIGDNQILWCTTELNTKEDIDSLVDACQSALNQEV